MILFAAALPLAVFADFSRISDADFRDRSIRLPLRRREVGESNVAPSHGYGN
jgi:hypothetical protein